MKSFIHILIVFWISQTVCCYRNISVFEKLHDFLSILNIENKCDRRELVSIIDKAEVEQDIFRLQHLNCSDTAVISKINDQSTKLKSIFIQCIDPYYIKLVDELYKLDSKLLKLRCEMSDEDVVEMRKVTNAEDDNNCAENHFLQFISCLFSDQEIVKMSKSSSNKLNFAIKLINGNQKQSEVVNRVVKCIQKNMRINPECGNTSKQLEYYFNILMKAFECKVNKTVDVAKSTIAVPLRTDDLSDIFENSTRNCEFEEFQDLSKMRSNIYSIMSFENVTKGYSTLLNSFCELSNKDEYKSIISKSAITLTKCVDPNFLNHVQKLKLVVLRLVDQLCYSKDTLISLANDIPEESENAIDKCLEQNGFQISGCVFSQVEVRELMNDSNLISNFTLELLSGNDKKCGVLNEVKMCIVEAMQNCNNTLYSNVFKTILDIILESINCKGYSEIKGVVVNVTPVDSSIKETCLTCTSRPINSEMEGVKVKLVENSIKETCLICTSSTSNQNCADPKESEFSQACEKSQNASCFTRVNTEGNVERGCLSVLDSATIEACDSNTCQICRGDDCNIGLFPAHRLMCHQCKSPVNGACSGAFNSTATVCPIYNSEDRCYIARPEGNYERGCVSSTKKCEDSNCKTCQGLACNFFDYNVKLVDNSIKETCLICTSSTSNQNCADPKASEFSQACEKSQNASCFTRVNTEGNVERGCLSVLDSATIEACDSNTCQICRGDDCNIGLFPAHRLMCHQCKSPVNGACSGAFNSAATVCPIYNSEDRCYIARTEGNYERGCVSSIKQCEDSNCQTCQGRACNFFDYNAANDIHSIKK